MPTALEEFRKARVHADAQAQRADGRFDWSGGESLLNVDGAAHGLYGIVKRQKESVAHGAHFLAVMRLAGGADEREVRSLHLVEVRLVAFFIVAAERDVAFRGARADHVS